MNYQVLVHKDEEGNWIAEVPRLPGCGSDGKTLDEALANVKDAIKGYIEALEADGLPLPDNQAEIITLDI
jgi:predicted RNase H-like HicB family nuclease